MKKLTFSIFLICFTTAISIFCLFFIEFSASKTESLIKEIQGEVRNENYQIASEKIENLKDEWQKDSDILSIIIHHDALDKVKQSINLMQNYLTGFEPQYADFWAESTRALNEIENIEGSETPTIANIF